MFTPLYGYFCMFFIATCFWHFLSTFLPPLPFLDVFSHNPLILPEVFLVFCNLLFLYLRSFRWSLVFHSDHVSSPFHPSLILPTIQALVPTSSRRAFILLLSTLYSPYPVVLAYMLWCCSSEIVMTRQNTKPHQSRSESQFLRIIHHS